MAFRIEGNQITPMQFKLCFTAQERIAIYALVETDPLIKDAMSLIDDPRLTSVDLSLPSTTNMLDYLGMLGVLAEGRKDQILSAEPQ
jgi:hypothetical protein